MLKRYRVTATALGLIFFSLSGQSQEQPAKSYPFLFPVEIVEDQATTDAREGREEEARQREIEDLAAQQGMNSATQAMNAATQRMANYAFWSTIFVAVGTLLLFYTLWLTRQANKSAQKAVDVTQRIGEAQVRAYLEFTDAKSIAGYHMLRIRCQLVNIGQSPASQINIDAMLVYEIEIMKPGKQIYPKQIGRDGWVEFCWPDTVSDSGSIKSIFDGSFDWVVKIEMNWADVFGKMNATTIMLRPHGGHREVGPDRREGNMIATLTESSYGNEADKGKA